MNPFNQKGGRLYIDPSYTEESAFDFFLKNSTLTLLTHTSIGCITITAKIDNITSPYYKLRINQWKEPVKIILIKLMLYNDSSRDITMKQINTIRAEPFEISTKTSFYKEVKNQINIYMSSFVKSLDPLCPCLLFYKENIDKNILLSLLNESVFGFFSYNKTNKIIKNFLETNVEKSIIVMEFFENCLPLSHFNILKKEVDVYNKFKYYSYAIYTALELHSIGYFHGDLHYNNILICPEEKYFTVDKPKNFGRAFIIDFGRTKYDNNIKDNFSTNTVCDNVLNVLKYEKFAINYCNHLENIMHYSQYTIESSLCEKLEKLDMYRKNIVSEILKILGPIKISNVPFYSSSDEYKIPTTKPNDDRDDGESSYIDNGWWGQPGWWGGRVIIENYQKTIDEQPLTKLKTVFTQNTETINPFEKYLEKDISEHGQTSEHGKNDLKVNLQAFNEYLKNEDFSEDGKIIEYLKDNTFMQNEETIKKFKEDINELTEFNRNRIETINKIKNTQSGSSRLRKTRKTRKPIKIIKSINRKSMKHKPKK